MDPSSDPDSPNPSGPCRPGRLLRSLVAWTASISLVLVQTTAWGQPHAEGVTAGQAANPVARGSVTSSSAAEVVPGYTATPSEAGGSSADLASRARARLAACALTPTDTVCQALTGATSSAQTPRDPVSPYDASVLAARRIAARPALELEDISAYYAGCAVRTDPGAPARTQLCRRYAGAAPRSCSRSLEVVVSRTNTCAAGEWMSSATSGSFGMAVQCLPERPVTQQRFRLTSPSGAVTFLNIDVAATRLSPQRVGTLSHGARPSEPPEQVWVTGSGCEGDDCRLTALVAQESRRVCSGSGEGEAACTEVRPFIEEYAACPVGSLGGDQIAPLLPDGDDGAPPPPDGRRLDPARCFTPYAGTGEPGQPGRDTSGRSPATLWAATGSREITGWRVNPAYGPVPRLAMTYERARVELAEEDRWTDACPPALAAPGRCRAEGSARCVEGPETRRINGVDVARACWRYATALRCAEDSAGGECQALADRGCTETGSTCREADPATGTCRVTEARYRCPESGGPATSVSSCPRDVFCLAGNCFDTRYTNDADFARTMSFMEAAREAGVYLDADRMRVFSGEANSCRNRLLTNCCGADPAGATMTNQRVFGAGSRLVFDILMNADNREFVYQGVSALLTGSGYSGTFSAYGVTVAVNGAAVPASSVVLYNGPSMVIAFDPWSLVIAVIIYIVMSAMSCNEQEGRIAMQEGARLCRAVGTYCSSCIRVLGRCVSCTTHTTGKCCFNSVLARIVNEQGRLQVGRGWGSAQAPDCSGFTIAELQRLDFAAMDLSEFYASIVPTLPDASVQRQRNRTRAPECYFGSGRCP